MPHIDPSAYHLVVLLWLLIAAIAYFALRRRVAPYGRHRAEGGAGIKGRTAWVLFELPSAISFAIVAWPSLASGRACPQGWLLFLLWEAHYLHRALVYPLRIRSPRRMPYSVVCTAIVFTTMNGLLNAVGLFVVGPELGWVSLGHPRLVLGLVLFVVGAFINIDSDNRLLANPRGPHGEYSIPTGGLFRFVSSPNYLGELVEWLGWAVATGSSAGLAFFVWTAANLVPRARSNHEWYQRHFPDYPAERRALIPRSLRGLFFAGFLLPGCAARAAIHAEVDIAAPPELVWEVLADLRRYPEWNPFTDRIDGTLATGNDLTLHVALTKGRARKLQRQRVTCLEPNLRLCWETKLLHRDLLHAARSQTLRALPDGGTHYETTDRFSGALVSLVMGLYRRDLEEGFSKMALALKARAEGLTSVGNAPATR